MEPHHLAVIGMLLSLLGLPSFVLCCTTEIQVHIPNITLQKRRLKPPLSCFAYHLRRFIPGIVDSLGDFQSIFCKFLDARLIVVTMGA